MSMAGSLFKKKLTSRSGNQNKVQAKAVRPFLGRCRDLERVCEQKMLILLRPRCDSKKMNYDIPTIISGILSFGGKGNSLRAIA